MWRPENLKNPHPELNCPWESTVKHLAFEAGADAMLEALRKKHGVRITEATKMVTQPIFEQGNGYLVFIPDEED